MKSLRDFFLRRITVYVGKAPGRIHPEPGRRAVILFPLEIAVCPCGIAGLIRIKRAPDTDGTAEIIQTLRRITGEIENRDAPAIGSERPDARETDLPEETAHLNRITASFKRNRPFTDLYFDAALTEQIVEVGGRLQRIAEAESRHLAANRESLSANRREAVSAHIEGLKDAAWCLKKEVGENLKKVRDLLPPSPIPHTAETIGLFKGINAVLNSIDRIEVRGRDSAGFTVMISINEEEYRRFRQQIEAKGQLSDLTERSTHEILGDGTIRIHKRAENGGEKPVYSIAFTYKFAAEIGRLGDNVSYLRGRIRTDAVLGHLLSLSYFDPTILAHTRWASVGAITVPNCHPTDNVAGGDSLDNKTIIQTVLNSSPRASEYREKSPPIRS